MIPMATWGEPKMGKDRWGNEVIEKIWPMAYGKGVMEIPYQMGKPGRGSKMEN